VFGAIKSPFGAVAPNLHPCIDVSCTLEFTKTAGIPNKAHSKLHSHGISGKQYGPINGKVSST